MVLNFLLNFYVLTIVVHVCICTPLLRFFHYSKVLSFIHMYYFFISRFYLLYVFRICKLQLKFYINLMALNVITRLMNYFDSNWYSTFYYDNSLYFFKIGSVSHIGKLVRRTCIFDQHLVTYPYD